MSEIKILGKSIPIENDELDIYKLKFLKDNPRVYACTHGAPNFEKLIEEEQQKIIYDKLKEEPSVKNLKPEIKRHGGLMEPILVDLKRMEVIEGNSRLAVYRILNEDKAEGEWKQIRCNIINDLTEPQKAAFLNQIHVKGKTQWSAYEKANFAYVRQQKGSDVGTIAKLFGESTSTIRTRVKTIEMMKDNKDNEKAHFSYYDVLARNGKISENMKKADGIENLLSDIKNLGSDEATNIFTARDLRNKLPVVLDKLKVLKKYINREISLDDAYQRAKISSVEGNIKQATELLSDIDKKEILALEQNQFNAFKQATRKLTNEAERIKKMVKKIGDLR